ncbi:Spo0E family sporulation regulatory protein-aspartic acid phosphatase [Clostridium tyrobutyricum]|uniref:Spo0E family sporulation regulatory protein-aspartic acid phosphatase n=1 Tax=Clostridium tyrobutyricum TaxID=1519 RepID=UPI001C386425|nr:Spo0E family sporulation regulatory protein-aspartic acid phosphatase [Clostridium tyrobutyricum]MBV4420401.1 Spo0E family sporulation regulatory protein-aspartic acid phosphatase [Clostridium tyrobutyricum]
MDRVKLMIKRIEEQRALLEQHIKQVENLSDLKIVTESQRLDVMINEYIKAKEIDEN